MHVFMTWDFLYPLITYSPTPWGWRTVARWLISLGLLLFLFLHHKDTFTKQKTKHIFSRDVLHDLENSIQEVSTQKRYNDYQYMLRSRVYSRYDIDIFSTTLENMSHNSLPDDVLNLMEQTYYFPYNTSIGDKKIMKEHARAFRKIIMSHEKM